MKTTKIKTTTAKPAEVTTSKKKVKEQLTVEDSGFSMGSRTKSKLVGVNPDLVAVTELALKYSKVDFGITCGVRSMYEQRQLVKSGASQTFHSKHLNGSAVDTLAYVDGNYTYEPFELYTSIAEAFFVAAKELNVKIMWGACWLDETSKFETAEAALEAYKETRRKQNRKVFLDGVHFELWDGRTHY